MKADSIKTINVPHLEGLTTDTMLYHARNLPGVMNAFPFEPREVEKLPRAYISNVIYTIVGPPFKAWVDEKIQQRTKKLLQEQNLAIEMDPEVYAAFKKSTSVSGKFFV